MLQRAAAIALLTGVAALSVYRAATQSITVDEAHTYLAYVKPPLRTVLSTYEANHHVLHSLLCKAATGILGASDFSLRIPALQPAEHFMAQVLKRKTKLIHRKAAWIGLG